ncbi:MAG: beta-hydroxyacyl-ACP dehydratase [Planctomycetes bacterium]|nr:beta-hydroxyacyl-ACP dehydratase [Planctomycetota bacterium]
MKFQLVDRIEQLTPGERIVTTKCLTSAEEYLADHFPAFPVMPGVLMLEACTQSAAWLVRLATGWQKSIVVLRRARNVRYASFVTPGQTLRIEATAGKADGDVHAFTCTGTVDGRTAVQAKIDLRAFCLADSDPAAGQADQAILADLRRQFDLCGGPAAADAAAAPRQQAGR